MVSEIRASARRPCEIALRSDRPETALLDEIRESITLIGRYIDGLSALDFEQQDLPRDATAFRLLIIGEAVSRLSTEVTDRLPHMDWRGMISLRHRLAHDYGSANYSVLWTIASVEVPNLAEALKDI